MLPKYAFFRDRIVPYADANVGVLTHALNYGTGCFAGLRGYWNSDQEELFVFRPHDHFKRFLESASLLRMDLPYRAADLVSHLLELIRAEEIKTDCYIRPLAFLADETLGVRLHGLTPVVSMVAFPFGKFIENDDGAHVTVSSWRRIDDNMIPARGKITGSYVNSALAKSDAHHAGFDDAILLNQEGCVSEGPTANVFLVRGGAVVTPPVTDDILEGIVRRTVISLLRDELGVPIVERSIDRSELFVSDEAFFAGTGIQIVPITRIDHRPVGNGRPGALTTNLRSLYFDVVRSQVAKYRSWCAPVYAPVSAAVSA
jgi:branched-chain amino acid aminotransferase